MNKLLFVILALVTASPALAQKSTSANAPFLMPVEDAFYITGRGTVLTGAVERGTVRTGDTLELIGENGVKEIRVAGIEQFRKVLDTAVPGDNVGLLIRGVEKAEARRGMLLAKPGSMRLYSKFKARIDLFPTAGGGRKTPIYSGYRPQVLARTATISAVITLPENKKYMEPGEKGVMADVHLISNTPLEAGQTLKILEGGKAIGSIVIKKLDAAK